MPATDDDARAATRSSQYQLVRALIACGVIPKPERKIEHLDLAVLLGTLRCRGIYFCRIGQDAGLGIYGTLVSVGMHSSLGLRLKVELDEFEYLYPLWGLSEFGGLWRAQSRSENCTGYLTFL